MAFFEKAAVPWSLSRLRSQRQHDLRSSIRSRTTVLHQRMELGAEIFRVGQSDLPMGARIRGFVPSPPNHLISPSCEFPTVRTSARTSMNRFASAERYHWAGLLESHSPDCLASSLPAAARHISVRLGISSQRWIQRRHIRVGPNQTFFHLLVVLSGRRSSAPTANWSRWVCM
jgi:hypothetical protein